MQPVDTTRRSRARALLSRRRMTRESVAALMGEAERELQAAQNEHDGSEAATVRYQAARDRHRQLTRLAAVLLSLSDPVATLAA